MMSKYILYEDCHVLPMNNFIECLVKNNLAALIMTGKGASMDVLESKWQSIYLEYIDLLEDESVKDIKMLMTEIHLAEQKFERTRVIVELLTMVHYPELAKELRKLGYPYEYNPANMDRYKEELKMTYDQAKTSLLTIKQKQNQLDKIRAKDVREKKITMADFNSMLVTLSAHFKYQVKPHELTVGQYCEMIKRVREDAKIMEAKIYAQKQPKNN